MPTTKGDGSAQTVFTVSAGDPQEGKMAKRKQKTICPGCDKPEDNCLCPKPSILVFYPKTVASVLKDVQGWCFDEMIDVVADVDKGFAKELRNLKKQDYVPRYVDDECIALTFYGWVMGYPKDKFWKRDDKMQNNGRRA